MKATNKPTKTRVVPDQKKKTSTAARDDGVEAPKGTGVANPIKTGVVKPGLPAEPPVTPKG